MINVFFFRDWIVASFSLKGKRPGTRALAARSPRKMIPEWFLVSDSLDLEDLLFWICLIFFNYVLEWAITYLAEYSTSSWKGIEWPGDLVFWSVVSPFHFWFTGCLLLFFGCALFGLVVLCLLLLGLRTSSLLHRYWLFTILRPIDRPGHELARQSLQKKIWIYLIWFFIGFTCDECFAFFTTLVRFV